MGLNSDGHDQHCFVDWTLFVLVYVLKSADGRWSLRAVDDYLGSQTGIEIGHLPRQLGLNPVTAESGQANAWVVKKVVGAVQVVQQARGCRHGLCQLRGWDPIWQDTDRHTGHVPLDLSHGKIHGSWKGCLHGRVTTICSSGSSVSVWNCSLQTAQSFSNRRAAN